ncbi:SGT1-domain-containing protein [Xylariaceae sp. FL0804]|nr:SGT1-domain-containing protein [Xylariaceae sp. FL0804]
MDSEDRSDFFQNGFDGFPRNLPENCVEYVLFLIDDRLQPRSLLAELESVRKAAIELCNKITKDYIWQREPFQLQLRREKDLVYLHGTTDYGDSVEDEWLIVYLLRELTKAVPSLWVRVADSDGEFLLVEAANVLPKWLSPEIDGNRVWIHQGMLNLLPLSASSGDRRPLSLVEAVGHIKTKPESLVHSSLVEAEAFYRLEKYPGQVQASLHRALITIPRKLAYVLHELPTAIAPAVEAFYLRDKTDMKNLISPTPDALHFPPRDLVTVSVKFTKVLFAQLKSQRFTAPPAWASVIETAEKRASDAEACQKSLDRVELGMKVTSGFEMLAATADGKDNRLAREFAIVLGDLKEDGEQALPSDKDIESWPGHDREDDEAWLDINFEDFENELQGKQGVRREAKSGFGDASKQADLQKIVSRFEAFLNDDKAGLEGAELDDMDQDDDISDENEGNSDEESEDEDKEVSFDEEQFSRMMREMMGLPADHSAGAQKPPSSLHPTDRRSSGPSQSETDAENVDAEDDEYIRQLAAQMESELKGLGALQLGPEPDERKQLTSRDSAKSMDKGKGKGTEESEGQDSDSEDEEVNIDYNLAKNLLESFKSQAGMAGPAGNILSMMGMQLPRDEEGEEEEEEEEEDKEKKK